MAGYTDNNEAIWSSVVPSFGNLIFTFTLAGLFQIDHLGALVHKQCRCHSRASHADLIYIHYSLAAMPISDSSCRYTNCGSCIANDKCGFCFAFDPTIKQYLNDTCSSVAAKDSYSINNNSCPLYMELPNDTTPLIRNLL